MKTSIILQEYIQKVLAEKRRADKEGVPTLRGLEVLEPYRNDIYTQIHFSSINKAGINPQQKWDTPLGIYGYPMTEQTWRKLELNKIEFRGDSKFLHIYKAKSRENTIITTEFSERDLKKKIEQLLEMFPEQRDTFSIAQKEAKVRTPAGRFWNITRHLADMDMKKWSSLLVQLGIQGVIDLNESIIHGNEPEQSVFFRSQFIELIGTIDNPLTNFAKKFIGKNVQEKSLAMFDDREFAAAQLSSGNNELSPRILERILDQHPGLVLGDYLMFFLRQKHIPPVMLE